MLHFLTLLMGPVFAKEMVEMARRKRYYFNRVLYGLVLLLALFIVFEEFRSRLERQWAPGRLSIRVMALLAEALFHAICSVQYAAVFLLVPLFLSGVIATEREERTLELLFTTHLSDREIVLGKLCSRMAALLLLIMCSMPIMSMIMLFGGIDPVALWRILCCTFLAVLYAGAHAIFFSAVTKSPMGALVRTYWWLAVWLLGVPLAAMLSMVAFSRSFATGGQEIVAAICMVNPVFMFVIVLTGIGWPFGTLSGFFGSWFFFVTFVFPSLWSVFLIWRAVCRLRLLPSPFAALLGRLPSVRAFRKRSRRKEEARSPYRRVRPERLWLIFRVNNPLWLRARLTRVYDREGYVDRIQWAAWPLAFFFLGLVSIADHQFFQERGACAVFLAPTWILIAALAAIVAGSSLVGDRRRGFFDLLLVTPLRPREIIDGTLLAIWRHLNRIYWLPLAVGWLFCLTGRCTLTGLFLCMGTATLFCVLLTVHGVACSLAARTMATALVQTFIFPLLVIVGTPMLMFYKEASGPVLWVLSGVALVASCFCLRWRRSPATIGFYFIAVHLCLVSLATCWPWLDVLYRRPSNLPVLRGEYAILATNPAYLAMSVLEGSSFSYFNLDGLYACYWSALVINILWARLWLVRNFEQLVGRPRRGQLTAKQSPPRAQPASLGTHQARRC